MAQASVDFKLLSTSEETSLLSLLISISQNTDADSETQGTIPQDHTVFPIQLLFGVWQSMMAHLAVDHNKNGSTF